MVRINSVNDVMVELEALRFEYLVNRTSAVKTMEKGKGACLEASLVAAYLMEDLGHEPRLFQMDAYESRLRWNQPNNWKNHVVFLYDTDKGFQTLGRSRYPKLTSMEEPVDTIDEVVEHYRRGFSHHRFTAFRWSVFSLDELQIPWRDSVKPLEVDKVPYLSGKGDGFQLV